MTVTHTLGVFALGLVTLGLSQFIVPEQLYPWLNLASGLLVVGVGARRAPLRGWPRTPRAITPPPCHAARPRPLARTRGCSAVGDLGRACIPCPTALVVLLAAISLHRVGYGLVLIVAFSIGLAAAITGIGLFAVLAKRAFARSGFEGRRRPRAPGRERAVVLVLGVVMTARALPKLA